MSFQCRAPVQGDHANVYQADMIECARTLCTRWMPEIWWRRFRNSSLQMVAIEVLSFKLS